MRRVAAVALSGLALALVGPMHQGYRAASAVAGGVNVEPSYRGGVIQLDSWWESCDSNWQTIAQNDLNWARQLGAKVVRLEFPWIAIQPTSAGFNWSRADAIMQMANSTGVQIQPILVYTPAWAVGRQNGASPAATDPPTAAAYGAFVSAIVSRNASHWGHAIRYWEMWNEPNGNYLDPNYNPTIKAQDYTADILIPGYNAAKAADSSAVVLFGEPDNGGSSGVQFYSDAYAAGAGHHFDIGGYHDYGGSGSAGIIGVMSSHGDGGKPVWIGEYGVERWNGSAWDTSTNDTWHQNEITNYLNDANGITNGVAMAIWYNLQDEYASAAARGGACGYSGEQPAFGVVQHSGTLKNSFTTMRNLLGGQSGPPIGPGPTQPPNPGGSGGSGGTGGSGRSSSSSSDSQHASGGGAGSSPSPGATTTTTAAATASATAGASPPGTPSAGASPSAAAGDGALPPGVSAPSLPSATAASSSHTWLLVGGAILAVLVVGAVGAGAFLLRRRGIL